MSATAPDVKVFKQWNAEQFGTYMRSQNLGQYYEAIISNDISGDTVARLTENDLKVRLFMSREACMASEVRYGVCRSGLEFGAETCI